MHSAQRANYKFILKDWTEIRDLSALSKTLETKRFSQNLKPVVISRPAAKSVLVIAPHPDDDIFSSAGTLLKLKRGGSRLKVVYLASGSADTYRDEKNRILSDSVIKIEEEAREASRSLGSDIEFWRYPNRAIKISAESMTRLKDIYDQLKPDIIFVPFIADDHSDHRQGAQLFYEAFRDSGDLSSEVWAYQVYSTVIPNVVVDITDEMDEKIRLVNLWQTRKKSRNWAHYIRGLNAINSRFLNTNEPRYAEAFFVVPAKEYVELCGIYFGNNR
ncbi:MAG: PIG-L family deacetylase [Candidatus Omnitrophica bacterium]|nr:PIG-L family deacetylase [Candidatus Omnitrophota bacterium]